LVLARRAYAFYTVVPILYSAEHFQFRNRKENVLSTQHKCASRSFHAAICSDGHKISSTLVTHFVFAESPSHTMERYHYY